MKWNNDAVSTGHQLEFALGENALGLARTPRRVSPERATWWFAHIQSRLRHAWRPAPPARPEQVGLFAPAGPAQRW